MSAALDEGWSSPLDDGWRARREEYEITAAARLESVEGPIQLFAGLLGEATAPGGEIVVESDAFQRVHRVSIPSHPRHALLVVPTANRALAQDARRRVFGQILDHREHADLWAEVQKLAPGALTGHPDDTMKLYKLVGVVLSDAEWAAALEPYGYTDDEYDYWIEGSPRVNVAQRRRVRQALKAWRLAIEPSAPVPDGYLRSRTEQQDWDETFDPAAQRALAGDAAAVEEVRALLAAPTRAGLVLPGDESCVVSVQRGRIVGIEFPDQKGRNGYPLGLLVFWTHGVAVDAHQEWWYTEVADKLPSPHESDPDPNLPRRFQAFQPVTYLAETDEIRERRAAFQSQTTSTTRERN